MLDNADMRWSEKRSGQIGNGHRCSGVLECDQLWRLFKSVTDAASRPLGKLALYQLSYARGNSARGGAAVEGQSSLVSSRMASDRNRSKE